MKTIALLTAALTLSGCARFSTTQTDTSDEKKGIRIIVTKAASYTLFTSKSDLAKWKASQTDKSQGAEVGGLTQATSGTNVVNALGHIERIVQSLHP